MEAENVNQQKSEADMRETNRKRKDAVERRAETSAKVETDREEEEEQDPTISTSTLDNFPVTLWMRRGVSLSSSLLSSSTASSPSS
mmetsp:Transcript_8312/g.15017  ORF Transcript_8312/g.15017 Transcript_8312/m.15017 type:complete len:86 (-) Transcript_8312:251-508(-)